MLMLGATAMDATLVQEKLAANTRDRSTAFESSEAAGRNGLLTLRLSTASGRSLPDNSLGYYNSGALPDTGGSIVAADSAALGYWEVRGVNSSNSQESSLTASAQVNAKGRFLVEHMRFDDESEPGSPTVYAVNFNAITARGVGNNGGDVTTQSTLMTVPR